METVEKNAGEGLIQEFAGWIYHKKHRPLLFIWFKDYNVVFEIIFTLL